MNQQSQQYEIEIKSLLGSKENAEKLKQKIAQKNGTLEMTASNKQLNHYFTYTDLTKFHDALLPHIADDKKELFSKIVKEGKNFSIRTREIDSKKVILVIKASLDDHSSSNGISRMEFESGMDMSLSWLDNLLLEAGLAFQAKWSREREEYKVGEVIVCLDKNAGYGYLAEFEKVVHDKAKVEEAKDELYALMEEFEVEELKQDRLERMFDYYNKHWADYYGTEKTFLIE